MNGSDTEKSSEKGNEGGEEDDTEEKTDVDVGDDIELSTEQWKKRYLVRNVFKRE